MGSYWTLKVAGETLLWGKNYLPDALMLIFSERDRFIDRERFAPMLHDDDAVHDDGQAGRPVSAYTNLIGYRASVGALRARLALQGFGLDRVWTEAIAYLDADRSDPDRLISDRQRFLEERYPRSSQLLAACLSPRTRAALAQWWQPPRGDLSPEDEKLVYLSSCWADLCEGFDDPRFALSLLLRGRRATSLATIDLSDVVLGGWMEAGELASAGAHARLEAAVGSAGKIIVVTEGRTDAEIMSQALNLARPNIGEMFSFLDFNTTSAPGGTGRLVGLTRGMAAAGVLNRVVAVFDNDAAGREGELVLGRNPLPSRFSVTRLPDVAYGLSYPTIGPTGLTNADINGRACSIELMFGVDLLVAANGGTLPPVKWGGYLQLSESYQGEVGSKQAIQAALRSQLDVSTIADLSHEMADGCERVATTIIGAAALALPSMASDFSPLLKWRVTEEG